MVTHSRQPTKREIKAAVRAESAVQTIGTLQPGCEMFGFTKGQFSLIDLIAAVLAQTGPADAVLSEDGGGSSHPT